MWLSHSLSSNIFALSVITTSHGPTGMPQSSANHVLKAAGAETWSRCCLQWPPAHLLFCRTWEQGGVWHALGAGAFNLFFNVWTPEIIPVSVRSLHNNFKLMRGHFSQMPLTHPASEKLQCHVRKNSPVGQILWHVTATPPCSVSPSCAVMSLLMS